VGSLSWNNLYYWCYGTVGLSLEEWQLRSSCYSMQNPETDDT
jgi:hypothetical protein